ncbi:hypothetical protein ACQ9BO_09025 [Flavobacterium sp. P21]|uniref:hypothetical protein n=1 Tax=Flavobacterium sp. P21 TaxID=3423948 RepID=UPI003D679694
MKTIFLPIVLVFVISATTMKAQSHFTALDQAVSVQLASLDTKESFMDKLVPDFKRETIASPIKEQDLMVLMNLPPSFNVRNWTTLYKKQVSTDADLKTNTAPSLIKNVETKLDF